MNTNDFDRQFNAQDKRLRKWFIFISLVWLSTTVSLIGFAVWVVIKLMQHYGVL